MHAIYKPGQGFYTRVCSAVGLALLALMGVAWLWKLVAVSRFLGKYEPVYGQATMAILILAILGALGYWLIGVNARTVDFLIATEGEMKKVNWSTRKEVIGSTTLVIGFTFFLAALCFLLDFLFAVFFKWIHVLDSARI
jgi:preprotein translocase SecE subunit